MLVPPRPAGNIKDNHKKHKPNPHKSSYPDTSGFSPNAHQSQGDCSGQYEPGAKTVEHANTEYAAATTADGNNDVRNNEAENLENTNTNVHEIDGVNIWVPKSRFKRQQKQLNKKPITIVFNYSELELTGAMEEVLNLELNLAILPTKLDITQVICDFKRF